MYGSLLALALLAPAVHPADQAQCVAEPTVKITTKNVYSSKCVDYCYSLRSPMSVLFGKDCPECGKVRTKTVLLKKTITEEKPGFKCVPGAPCATCETGAHPHR